MPHAAAHRPDLSLPQLSAGEWQDVQRAVRAVGGVDCPKATGRGAAHTGPLHRGLAQMARIVPSWRRQAAAPIAPELQHLRDFLCETARHGPAVDDLAMQLQNQGFTIAQIAALSFIAG